MPNRSAHLTCHCPAVAILPLEMQKKSFSPILFIVLLIIYVIVKRTSMKRTVIVIVNLPTTPNYNWLRLVDMLFPS